MATVRTLQDNYPAQIAQLVGIELTTENKMSAVNTHSWEENWSPIVSFQGAVLQRAGWPKFDATGNIKGYMEFKKQWQELDKTGIGDKKVLKIMWDHSLPKNLTKNPCRFADVDAVWAWLEKLFSCNELCCMCQGMFGKCPKDTDPVQRYDAMLSLRKEVWNEGHQDWWNLAAVNEILNALPEGERQVWSQFIIDDGAIWIEYRPAVFGDS
jgi:hypothetical protein